MRRAILLTLLVFAPAPAFAQATDDAAISRGVAFLRARASGMQTGEAALSGLALIKSHVPHGDAAIQTCLAKVLARFQAETYTPERAAGYSNYEAGVVSMFLANLDPEAYRAQLEAVARYLQGTQLPRGCWDYANRSAGDCSISQYGVLGLWEAENSGVIVPPRVWDQAARFYLSVQDPEGCWRYHPDEGGSPTLSMTAAGIGSLLICQRQLEPYRKAAQGTNQLLNPLVNDDRGFGSYRPEVSNGAIDAAVRRGLNWLASHYVINKEPQVGQTVYYALYGMERIGALAGKQQFGGIDWFERGRGYILSTQEGDGSWKAQHGEDVNTAWSLLYLTKSTAQTVRRVEIKRLGAGTLIGGRGLPKDLSSLTIAGGRVLSQPMNGAVEGMLAVVEDPRAEQADAALAGLVQRYRVEGAAAVRPHKDRFRKLLATDPDPGIRAVAAWALGRTGDLDVVPALIGGIEDADDGVVSQARSSLQLLSRKVDGYGPDPGADAAARALSARRWREWYDGVRPPNYSLDPVKPQP